MYKCPKMLSAVRMLPNVAKKMLILLSSKNCLLNQLHYISMLQYIQYNTTQMSCGWSSPDITAGKGFEMGRLEVDNKLNFCTRLLFFVLLYYSTYSILIFISIYILILLLVCIYTVHIPLNISTVYIVYIYICTYSAL